MANPRQRRKLRSGSSTKPSNTAKREQQKKLVRAPTIKGAKVIQDSWDPKLTVRQNYHKLGLMGNLSMRDSGGKEKDYSLQGSSLPETIRKKHQGMAKVIRDEEGNIVSVEETEQVPDNTAWGPVLNTDDEEKVLEILQDEKKEETPKTAVTESLEELSKTVKAVPRFTSQAEKSWLHRLVAKHGSDTSAMSRDKLDNIWQRTEGEIKRAIKKAGGMEAFLMN